jgi:tetratricopeptide (TPR) repeat protein
LQVLVLMYFNLKYFLKTRDYISLIPIFIQTIAVTFGIMSVWNFSVLNSAVEFLLIITGIILPLLFMFLDKPLLKRRVLLPMKFTTMKMKEDIVNLHQEIVTIIPEKDSELVLSNMSSKDFLKKVQTRFLQAKKFIDSKQFDKALEIYAPFESIIQNPYYFYNYANILFRTRKFEEAKKYYKRALELLTKKEEATRKKKRPKLAAKHLKKEEVLYNIANSDYMLGGYCEAMSNYEKVLATDRSFKGGIDNYIQVLVKLKDFEKAVLCCNSLMEDEKDYRYYFLLAKIYYELNKNEKCIEQLNRVLKINEKHVESLALLGEVYSSTDNPRKAVDVYNRLLKLTPQDYAVHYSLGKLLLSIDDYDQAIERFSFAHNLNGTMFEALYNVALAHEKKGEFIEAIDVYKKVIQTKPDFLGAYTRLWYILSQKNMYEDVVDIFKKGVENFPQEYVLHFYLGVAYSKLCQYSQALEAFKNVLDINPDIKGVNFYLGITLTKLQKYEEAIHTFRNALLDAPEDNEVFYNMSITYCMQERYDRALISLRKALELNPEIKEKIFQNEVFECLKNNDEFKRLAC